MIPYTQCGPRPVWHPNDPRLEANADIESDLLAAEVGELSDHELIAEISRAVRHMTVASIVDGLRGAEKIRVLTAIETALRRMV